MPRPISGHAVPAAERMRRLRARQKQAAEEARQRHIARMEAEREARKALTAEVVSTAHIMLDSFAEPICKRDIAERIAWKRLLSYIDQWPG